MRNKLIITIIAIAILFLFYKEHQVSNEMSNILQQATETIRNGTTEDAKQILNKELMDGYEELSKEQSNYSRATFLFILALLGFSFFGNRKK